MSSLLPFANSVTAYEGNRAGFTTLGPRFPADTAVCAFEFMRNCHVGRQTGAIISPAGFADSTPCRACSILPGPRLDSPAGVHSFQPVARMIAAISDMPARA